MTRTDTLPASRALAFLRILTGLGLLFGAYGKFMIFRVAGAVPFPVVALHWQLELPARLATWLVQHPTGMLSAIVRDLLVPHGPLAAALVAWAQVIAGVLLLLGLRTRFAAILTAFVSISLALAAGYRDPQNARPYLMLMALAFAFFVGGAGQTFGMDGWRHERRRNREL